MKNQLILVDSDNNVLGYGEKLSIHKSGKLHRAFSLFVIDVFSNKILLQKRAEDKYHSGGLWSNSCCSHPYADEKTGDSLRRCLKAELGIDNIINVCSAKELDSHANYWNYAGFVDSFLYYAEVSNLIENELDSVYIYYIDSVKELIVPNISEVESIKWYSLEEIDKMLTDAPQMFTIWFSRAYTIAKLEIMKDRFKGIADE